MKKAVPKPKIFSHILIMMMALILAVVATFSWLPRNKGTNPKGNMLTYTQTGYVNGSGGEVHTYAGTNVDGIVTYSDTELSDSDNVTAAPNKINYFKTVIQDNTTNETKNVVSVYLKNLKFSTNMDKAFHIGLTNPEKTYKNFSATTVGSYNVVSSLCLEDNIIINAGDTHIIYWFIYVDSSYSGTGNIVLDTMNLVYN